MLSLFAAVVLSSTGSEPSAAVLAPHFVDALAQADEAPPPPPPMPGPEAAPAPAAHPTPADAPTRADPYAGKSHGWLRAEKMFLEESRPTIAPLALIAGGGAALLFISVLSAVIRPGLGGLSPLPGGWLALFGIMGGAGLVAGGIMLFFAMARASQIDSELEAVKDALDRVAEPPPPAQPEDIPAAMPPQVRLPPPAINVTLARF